MPDRTPEHDPTRDWETANPFTLVTRLLETRFVGPAARYASDVDEAIARTRPDLVCCSMFCFGAMLAAESAGVPFDVFMPNIYLLPAPGMPPFGLGLTPARGLLGRTRDALLSQSMTRLWDQRGLAALNALRAARELPALDHVWDQVHRARRELIMTSSEFDFPARLPASARYAGAVLDDPTWAAPSGAESFAAGSGDPLVLIAMSSTFQDQLTSLRNVAAAAGRLPIRAVLTTGPALEPSAVQAPANVRVVRSAPHAQLLPHTVSVVTHGGHGTIAKALAAGVPLVVMPHGRDQVDNAARVRTRGAGLTVRRSDRPEVIARAMRRVLDEPSFRDNARRLGAIIRSDADSGALVGELEDLLRAG